MFLQPIAPQFRTEGASPNMSQEYVHVTYLVHGKPGSDFQKKAQGIAIGLTVGSWTDLPAARKEAMQKHL